MPDALPFRIALEDDVPTDGREGQPLRFAVIDNLQIGDTVVLAGGRWLPDRSAPILKKRISSVKQAE
jgi:hypothetical protein